MKPRFRDVVADPERASAPSPFAALLRALQPAAVPIMRDYATRFRRLGYGSLETARACLSRPKRRALRTTCLDLLPCRVRQLDVVVDVGANVGDWSRGVLLLAKPTKLIAFEPSPVVLPRLRSALEGQPGVEVIPVAVGAGSGKIDLFLTRNDKLTSALMPRDAMSGLGYGEHASVREVVQVDCTSLDEALGVRLRPDDRVSLLKVDVQGYEGQVLTGASRTLERTACLLAEVVFTPHYQGDLSFLELHAMLEREHGFSLYNLAHYKRNAAGQVLFTDAVFINPRLVDVGGSNPLRDHPGEPR